MVNIQGITTTPYTPQSNGCVQRINGTLKSVLKKLFTENTNEWDELFPFVLFAYREVPHEEIGLAPFELLYGWPVRGPTQLLEGLMTGEDETQKSVIDYVVKIRNYLADVTTIVQENLTTRKRKIKEWYGRNSVHCEFGAGDEVLVLLPSDTSKMKAQWKGPYRVVQKINNKQLLPSMDVNIQNC
jgi:hypothetical protein